MILGPYMIAGEAGVGSDSTARVGEDCDDFSTDGP